MGSPGTGGTTAGSAGTTGAGGNVGDAGAAGSIDVGTGGVAGTTDPAGVGGMGAAAGAPAGTTGSAGAGDAGTTGAAGRGGTTGLAGTTGAAGRGGTTGVAGTTGAAGRGGTTGAAGTTGSGGTGAGGGPNPTGPCDIYQAGGTPCAAAHSVARALYSAYTGPLYQVQRSSDNTTKDIMVGSGGFSDMATQDSFCSGATCTIPVIYDQSPNANHLRVTWWAYWLHNGAKPANVTSAKIKVGGHTVSGIFQTAFSLDVGYRTGVKLPGKASVTKGSTTVTFTSPQTIAANSPLFFAANTADCPDNSFPNNCHFKPFWTAADVTNATTVTLKNAYDGTASSSTDAWNHATRGMPTGDESEAEYMVIDAKRYSQYCCFGYGNAELSGWDEGNATMEVVHYGNCTQFGQSGGGSGPWVGADLENGMFEGWENGAGKVPSNTSITGINYVTAMVKGPTASSCPSGMTSSGCFGLKAGDAQSGKLAWKFNANTSTYGPRPPGYSPQKKQGAIILATGGDGSNGGTGTWFEGVVVKGLPSDATDDAVQANIVAVGYGR
ncbi:MAG TPA: arabinofuranosidase catalytic domain-containing protein [Polyangia bacterium]|nr:arabinofuranosidase catalytic domain-containing protein [Polyangia bacterium]